MQQGLEYAETLDIPFVFASKTAKMASCSTTGRAAAPEKETTLGKQ